MTHKLHTMRGCWPTAHIFAQHMAHHSSPVHPELAELAAQHGYEVAYDGLTISWPGC